MSDPPSSVYSYIAIIARLEVIAEQLATSVTARTALPAEDPTEDAAESSTQAALAGSGDAEESWKEVEGELRRIADGLREKDTRGPLGNTSLPSLLTTFARLILLLPPHVSSSTASAVVAHHTQPSPSVPSIERLALAENEAVEERAEQGKTEWADELRMGDEEERVQSVRRRAGVVKEIGRVAANLCIDEDDNRAKLALYQYPAALVQMLAVLAADIRKADHKMDDAVVGALKGLVGSALNTALGETAAIKTFLLQPASLDVLLNLYQALMEVDAGQDEEDVHSLALWLWRTIGAAASEDTIRIQPSPPLLIQTAIRATRVFLPDTHSSATSAHRLAEMAPADSLLILNTACALLERTYVDTPAALPELVRTEAGPSATYLHPLLEFVDHAEPLASWSADGEDEDEDEDDGGADAETAGLSTHEKWERQLGVAKASVLRIVVELSGEVDLGDTQSAWLRETLFGWLEKRGHVAQADKDRPDLMGCALLCLGNYARSDARATDLLSTSHKPPLLPAIRPLLRGSTDVQVQHALVGLLKNLAIPKANKAALGSAGVIEGLCDMGVWLPAKDTLGSVQGGGVGVAKHLCYGDASNSLRIANKLSASTKDGPLRQLLALSRRSDDAAIRCEIARVLVNITRSLFMGADGAADQAERIAEGKRCMADEQVVRALLGLLSYGKTSGHAILINEAVLALALICQDETGLALIAGQLASTTTEPSSTISSLLSLLSEAQPPIEDGLGQSRQLVVPTESKVNMIVLLRLVTAAWQADGAHADEVKRVRDTLRQLADEEGTDQKLRQLLQG